MHAERKKMYTTHTWSYNKNNKKSHRNTNKFDDFIVLLIEQKTKIMIEKGDGRSMRGRRRTTTKKEKRMHTRDAVKRHVDKNQTT